MNYVRRIFREISQLTGQEMHIAEPTFSAHEINFFLKKTGLIVASISLVTGILLIAFS
ncbi:MAG: hypothetical protein AAGI07_16815 [Bacteroidota bacterium]